VNEYISLRLRKNAVGNNGTNSQQHLQRVCMFTLRSSFVIYFIY